MREKTTSGTCRLPVAGCRLPVSCLLFLLSCAAPKAAPTTTPVERGILVVASPVPDAALWVDDRLVGEVGRLPAGVQLRAGEHRVELRHDAYHTRYAEVTLAPGERKLLELSLTEALP